MQSAQSLKAIKSAKINRAEPSSAVQHLSVAKKPTDVGHHVYSRQQPDYVLLSNHRQHSTNDVFPHQVFLKNAQVTNFLEKEFKWLMLCMMHAWCRLEQICACICCCKLNALAIYSTQ